MSRVRTFYPKTPIVCVAGPSSFKSNFQKFRNFVSDSEAKFSETNDQVYYFHFTPRLFDGTHDHPVVVEHQFHANEMYPFLKQILEENGD